MTSVRQGARHRERLRAAARPRRRARPDRRARSRALCDRRAGHRRRRRPARRAARPRTPRRRRWPTRPSGSWTTATPTARAEMCGNGVRVFARYLVDAGLGRAGRAAVATRGGVTDRRGSGRTATSPSTWAGPADRRSTSRPCGSARPSWPATEVDVGNPHAWSSCDRLADAGRRCASHPAVEPRVPARRQRRVRRAPRRPATSRCGSTSAASGRPGPAAPGRVRRGRRRGGTATAQAASRSDVRRRRPGRPPAR